jgi:hypothetical protein
MRYQIKAYATRSCADLTVFFFIAASIVVSTSNGICRILDKHSFTTGIEDSWSRQHEIPISSFCIFFKTHKRLPMAELHALFCKEHST